VLQLIEVGKEQGCLEGQSIHLCMTEGVITINVPVVYMARDAIILIEATSITRAIGRGGP
jgi:hypothetical protein